MTDQSDVLCQRKLMHANGENQRLRIAMREARTLCDEGKAAEASAALTAALQSPTHKPPP